MCLVRRFWGDSAEQAEKCSTPPVRSVASGKRPTLLSELMRRSRKLTVPTSLDRSRKVRPGPNGRGAERGGRVVEKNCIMWVDKLVLWEYTVSRLIGGGREVLQIFEVSELLLRQQTVLTRPCGDRKTLKKFEVN